ncbi:hypothetical protein [Hungatella hathewayi]
MKKILLLFILLGVGLLPMISIKVNNEFLEKKKEKDEFMKDYKEKCEY